MGTTRGGLWEIWAVDKDARKFASFCSEVKPTFRRKPMFYSTPKHGFSVWFVTQLWSIIIISVLNFIEI